MARRGVLSLARTTQHGLPGERALGLHPSCQETEPQRSNSYHDDPEAGWASTEMVLIDGVCSANQDKELQAASSLANPLLQ